jgi:MFS family permease
MTRIARISSSIAAGSTIAILVKRTGDDGVLIAVADHCPGIPPEHCDRIFDRFFRADQSRTRNRRWGRFGPRRLDMTRLPGARDARLIYAAGFVRSATVSLVGVTLALHLADVGFSTTQIGLLIGVGLAGSSLATVIVSLRGDAWGRRRVLVGLALLSAMGYLALAVFTDAVALVPLAFIGMLNGMGRDRGAASALDQAILPVTVPDERRTWALAWYNLALDGGHALGALAATIPTVLVRSTALEPDAAHRVTFLMCAGAALICIVPYLKLTPHIEAAVPTNSPLTRAPLDARSKRVVTRLALLFGLDSIGGGFLNSALIAYWFFQQYGMSEANIAVLFFGARVLNALSHLAAAWLARRIGLLNTMVWTHLPSSLFLIAVPASPSAAIAGALFLAREALVEMDVPTRQSYVMAVVKPSDRTFASGVTNVTRNIAWAVGPSVAGVVMQHVALAGPLVIGGTLKIGYDLLLYRAFRHVRPPEEECAPDAERVRSDA